MIRMLAHVRLSGDLTNDAGESVTRIEKGAVLLVDANNARSLLRKNQASPAPEAKKKTAKKKG